MTVHQLHQLGQLRLGCVVRPIVDLEEGRLARGQVGQGDGLLSDGRIRDAGHGADVLAHLIKDSGAGAVQGE